MRYHRVAAVFDLDGVVADNRRRLRHIILGKADWKAYYEETLTDLPILPGILLYNSLLSAGVTVFLSTGRSELSRADTITWLEVNNVRGWQTLFMRGAKDHRKAADIKRSVLHEIRHHGFSPIIAFDDQPDIVRMYREEGAVCYCADDRNWHDGTYFEVPSNT